MTSNDIRALIDRSDDLADHWYWRGAWSCTGYPTVWYKGRTYIVTTLLYKKYVGIITPGNVLRRACTEDHCISPYHRSQLKRIECMGSKLKQFIPRTHKETA